MSLPASNTVATGRNDGDSLSDNFRRSMPTVGPLVALVILIIVFSLLNGNFFSLRNATNVLQQAAVLTVLALGETFVITTGSIDLTIGSTVSMVGMLAALLIRDHMECAGGAGGAVGRTGHRRDQWRARRLRPAALVSHHAGHAVAVNGMTLYLTQGAAIGVEPTFRFNESSTGFCLGRRRSRSGSWRLGCYPYTPSIRLLLHGRT
jgi:ribose/xylose/arabinose/galactoside ABC-type transport system permease subunit